MEMKDRLMKFGDDVKSGAEKLAKGAIDGSKKMAEKVKIKNVISQAESRLNAVYLEIGKKYEELHGTESEEAFVELLAQAADAKAQITAAKVDLAAVDCATICSGCGGYVQEGQRFCPHCGTKQPEPAVPEEAAAETPEETAEKLNEAAAAGVEDAVAEAAETTTEA